MKFKLTLEKTYYDQGFFNVKVDYDRYIRSSEGPITIQLGIGGAKLDGTVDRHANTNNTARVSGRAELRNWFHKNFKPKEEVSVEVVSPEHIILQEPS